MTLQIQNQVRYLQTWFSIVRESRVFSGIWRLSGKKKCVHMRVRGFCMLFQRVGQTQVCLKGYLGLPKSLKTFLAILGNSSKQAEPYAKSSACHSLFFAIQGSPDPSTVPADPLDLLAILNQVFRSLYQVFRSPYLSSQN